MADYGQSCSKSRKVTTKPDMDAAQRRRLFATNMRTIRRLARRFARSADEADDIAQEVALVVFTHDLGPGHPDSFLGWCHEVARNVAMHKRRSEARSEVCTRRLEATAKTHADDDPETLVSTRRLLAGRLRRLDTDSAALLWNRFVLEETSVELASRLNISANGVRMRLARLLAGLRGIDHQSNDDETVERDDPMPSGN